MDKRREHQVRQGSNVRKAGGSSRRDVAVSLSHGMGRSPTFDNSKEMSKETGVPHFRDLQLDNDVGYKGTNKSFTGVKTWEDGKNYYDIFPPKMTRNGYDIHIRVRSNNKNPVAHAQGFNVNWKMKEIGKGTRSNGSKFKYYRSDITISDDNKFVEGKVKKKVKLRKRSYTFACDMKAMPTGIDNRMLMRVVADAVSEGPRKHGAVRDWNVEFSGDGTTFSAFGEDQKNAKTIAGQSPRPIADMTIEDEESGNESFTTITITDIADEETTIFLNTRSQDYRKPL